MVKEAEAPLVLVGVRRILRNYVVLRELLEAVLVRCVLLLVLVRNQKNCIEAVA